MYLVGLCKLGTTFLVNFVEQRCKITNTAASVLCLLLQIGGEKSVDFAWACLSDVQTTCVLRLFSAAPRGDHKSNFYCCTLL